MKYTKYFINGNYIDVDTLNAMPKILFPFTLAAAIFAFIFGIAVIPMTITLDGLRGVKYASIRFERKHQLIKKVAQLKHF